MALDSPYLPSRFADEVDRRQRASGATGNTSTLLVLRLFLLRPPRGGPQRPRPLLFVVELDAATRRIITAVTDLDFHTSLRPLLLTTTILALYYQFLLLLFTVFYYYITTTTLPPLLCSRTCTLGVPGNDEPFGRKRGKLQGGANSCKTVWHQSRFARIRIIHSTTSWHSRESICSRGHSVLAARFFFFFF